MLRAATILAVLLAATAANAQQSVHPKDPEAGVPLYKRKFAPPEGSLDWLPEGARIVATIRPQPLAGLQPIPPTAVTPEPIVIHGGMGGLISEHQYRFLALKQQNATVEMRGGCWSACTLITGYIPKDRLCFAAGSFLAFHAAQTADHRLSMNDTWMMYFAVPTQIQNWLDANGGPIKMTVDKYWFLRDVDLWNMGYPRCKA